MDKLKKIFNVKQEALTESRGNRTVTVSKEVPHARMQESGHKEDETRAILVHQLEASLVQSLLENTSVRNATPFSSQTCRWAIRQKRYLDAVNVLKVKGAQRVQNPESGQNCQQTQQTTLIQISATMKS